MIEVDDLKKQLREQVTALHIAVHGDDPASLMVKVRKALELQTASLRLINCYTKVDFINIYGEIHDVFTRIIEDSLEGRDDDLSVNPKLLLPVLTQVSSSMALQIITLRASLSAS